VQAGQLVGVPEPSHADDQQKLHVFKTKTIFQQLPKAFENEEKFPGLSGKFPGGMRPFLLHTVFCIQLYESKTGFTRVRKYHRRWFH